MTNKTMRHKMREIADANRKTNIRERVIMLEAQVQILRQALMKIGTGDIQGDVPCYDGGCDKISAFARDAL